MKREEFEGQFNVDDTIIRGGLPVKIISYEGDEDHKFSGKTDGEISGKLSIDSCWSLYKEPIKKDLEDLIEVFQVFRTDKDVVWKLQKVNLHKEMANGETMIEYLTKEQAIERGLKTD
tara:strand:- start:3334 stop:3687 length:354 start_codon:yes stop_codon:yes gene_type:complete